MKKQTLIQIIQSLPDETEIILFDQDCEDYNIIDVTVSNEAGPLRVFLNFENHLREKE